MTFIAVYIAIRRLNRRAVIRSTLHLGQPDPAEIRHQIGALAGLFAFAWIR